MHVITPKFQKLQTKLQGFADDGKLGVTKGHKIYQRSTGEPTKKSKPTRLWHFAQKLFGKNKHTNQKTSLREDMDYFLDEVRPYATESSAVEASVKAIDTEMEAKGRFPDAKVAKDETTKIVSALEGNDHIAFMAHA